MRLAVIPARGGSQRIPRKNIKLFGGLPMIAWSIRAAQASGCFDRIIVSTDDPDIAAVAQDLGADVPFMRPAELADHHTGTVPVIAHAVAWQQQEQPAEWVCCVYATAPFVQPADLQRGFAALRESRAEYAVAVTSYAFPIQRALRITANQRLAMFQPQHQATRSQDLEAAWHDAGQFYWGRAQVWLQHTPLLGPDAVPVPLPRYRVQDIDTPEDWERAEWLFKAMQAAREQPQP